MRIEDPARGSRNVAGYGRRRRVVVIAGHAILRATLAGILGEIGFEAREAEDGASGLREVRRDAPDLVVLDPGLPGLPGPDVLADIRAHAPTATLPVLLVTDPSDGPMVVGEAERALAKPFSYFEFVRAVQALAPAGTLSGAEA